MSDLTFGSVLLVYTDSRTETSSPADIFIRYRFVPANSFVSSVSCMRPVAESVTSIARLTADDTAVSNRYSDAATYVNAMHRSESH